MANVQKEIRRKRQRKALSVRSRVRGSAEKPRLSVFRSSKYMYAQAIDDVSGRTLSAVSELEAELKQACAELTKTEAAKVVGKAMAERLKSRGIERVVFDRGHYRYHGRIKAFADAAREGGLQF